MPFSMYLNSLGISTIFCKIWLSVYCEWVCCMYLVVQACLSLCNPMGCSWPGSSVHGISQAKILEWVAISFSRDLPDPGIEPESLVSPALAASWILYHWATREAQACLYHSINSSFAVHLSIFVTKSYESIKLQIKDSSPKQQLVWMQNNWDSEWLNIM